MLERECFSNGSHFEIVCRWTSQAADQRMNQFKRSSRKSNNLGVVKVSIFSAVGNTIMTFKSNGHEYSNWVLGHA